MSSANRTGNLIVRIPVPGRGAGAQSPSGSTHMDTVPLCAGARPKQQGKKIVNTAKSALVVTPHGLRRPRDARRRAPEHKLEHPPLTLLFHRAEESGLWGARHVKREDLGGVRMGFNFDGRSANDVRSGQSAAFR